MKNINKWRVAAIGCAIFIVLANPITYSLVNKLILSLGGPNIGVNFITSETNFVSTLLLALIFLLAMRLALW